MDQGLLLKGLIASNRPDLTVYEALRRHFHEYPELSGQEIATSEKVASHLRSLKDYDVYERIGGYGVAAVLKNGEGKVVLLRADMDALPIQEKTSLEFASKITMKDGNGVVQPVMQACGHDIHVTCLLAAAEAMVNMRAFWKGTLILVFQPAEELGDGAKAMVEDGLYKKVPIPDVVLGQHVMPDRAGRIGNRTGAMLAASDSLKITLFGRGGHASMPSKCIDPIVMAAAVVMKLQTIVSRELDPKEFAVLTIGSLQAGSAENVIADRAEMKVNVRTADSKIKAKVLAAIERIIKSECEASAAPLPPLIEKTSSFPVTYNDEGITRIVQSAFSNFFGKDFNPEMPFVNGSEDFSYLGTSIDRPTCFWMIGGTDPKIFDKAEKEGKLDLLPVNHSALFAPVMQPTIKVGVDALTLAAMRFLEA